MSQSFSESELTVLNVDRKPEVVRCMQRFKFLLAFGIKALPTSLSFFDLVGAARKHKTLHYCSESGLRKLMFCFRIIFIIGENFNGKYCYLFFFDKKTNF